jgi:hypothetical protein
MREIKQVVEQEENMEATQYEAPCIQTKTYSASTKNHLVFMNLGRI